MVSPREDTFGRSRDLWRDLFGVFCAVQNVHFDLIYLSEVLIGRSYRTVARRHTRANQFTPVVA